MIIGTPLELVSLFVGVVMVMLVLWVILIAYVYTDKAESYLPASEYIKGMRRLYLNAGLFGKALRNGSVTLVLMTPNSLIKKGLLDPEEVKNFPPGLKRMLCVSWGLATLFWSAGMALGIYGIYKDAMQVFVHGAG